MVFSVTCVIVSLTYFEACAMSRSWSTTSLVVSHDDMWRSSALIDVFTRVLVHMRCMPILHDGSQVDWKCTRMTLGIGFPRESLPLRYWNVNTWYLSLVCLIIFSLLNIDAQNFHLKFNVTVQDDRTLLDDGGIDTQILRKRLAYRYLIVKSHLY
jgi:hypothetical protein